VCACFWKRKGREEDEGKREARVKREEVGNQEKNK
jgi:hypothetical protein